MFPDFTRDDVFRVESRRLWLRWPHKGDCARIAHMAGGETLTLGSLKLAPAVSGASSSIDSAEHLVHAARAINGAGTGLVMAITLKDRPGEIIGLVGIEMARGVPTMSYWLGRPFRGKGLMTEALRSLSAMVFSITLIDRLESMAQLANPAARRVLEKAGFVAPGAALPNGLARRSLPAGDMLVLTRKGWRPQGAQDAPGNRLRTPQRELVPVLVPGGGDAGWSARGLHA